jgi:hypothetical protein
MQILRHRKSRSKRKNLQLIVLDILINEEMPENGNRKDKCNEIKKRFFNAIHGDHSGIFRRLL